MTKAANIKKWMVAGAAAVAAYLCIHKKKTVSGIGDVPVWNKGHIKNWLAYEHYQYPEKIIVTGSPYYVNDGCVAVWSYADRYARNWQYDREFSIREKDVDYLRDLCAEHGVEFIEM